MLRLRQRRFAFLRSLRPKKERPRSQVATVAEQATSGLAPPEGIEGLRLRILKLALTPDGGPRPEALEALRHMSLEEALLLEDVAHHRQWEATLTSEALVPPAEPEGP